MGKLAIETDRKVIPIWLEDEKEAAHIESEDEFATDDPRVMLQRAEDVLSHKIDYDKVYIELSNRFYNGMAGVESSANDRILYVGMTAYQALEIALLGIKNLPLPKIAQEASDINKGLAYRQDFAGYAEIAVGLINPDDSHTRILRRSYPEDYPILLLDNEKRLAFWEWWITEAVPHAWESAIQL